MSLHAGPPPSPPVKYNFSFASSPSLPTTTTPPTTATTSDTTSDSPATNDTQDTAADRPKVPQSQFPSFVPIQKTPRVLPQLHLMQKQPLPLPQPQQRIQAPMTPSRRAAVRAARVSRSSMAPGFVRSSSSLKHSFTNPRNTNSVADVIRRIESAPATASAPSQSAPTPSARAGRRVRIAVDAISSGDMLEDVQTKVVSRRITPLPTLRPKVADLIRRHQSSAQTAVDPLSSSKSGTSNSNAAPASHLDAHTDAHDMDANTQDSIASPLRRSRRRSVVAPPLMPSSSFSSESGLPTHSHAETPSGLRAEPKSAIVAIPTMPSSKPSRDKTVSDMITSVAPQTQSAVMHETPVPGKRVRYVFEASSAAPTPSPARPVVGKRKRALGGRIGPVLPATAEQTTNAEGASRESAIATPASARAVKRKRMRFSEMDSNAMDEDNSLDNPSASRHVHFVTNSGDSPHKSFAPTPHPHKYARAIEDHDMMDDDDDDNAGSWEETDDDDGYEDATETLPPTDRGLADNGAGVAEGNHENWPMDHETWAIRVVKRFTSAIFSA